MKNAIGKRILTTVVLILLFISVSNAQFLEKRTRIELKGGIWNQSNDFSASVVGGEVTSNYSGEGGLGGLIVSHWIQEDIALLISVSALAVDIENRVGPGSVYDHSVVVAPILFGARYYFPHSTFGTSWRPYVTGAIGPVIGNDHVEEVAPASVTVTEHNEMAVGGHLGGGVDISLSRLFMLGFSGGYYFQSDFEKPVGGNDNYNGPEFGLSFSLLLGKGVNK